MLVWLLNTVAIAFGAGFLVFFGRSAYHQWSQRGSVKAMLMNLSVALALGGATVVTLIIADHLQSI